MRGGGAITVDQLLVARGRRRKEELQRPSSGRKAEAGAAAADLDLTNCNTQCIEAPLNQRAALVSLILIMMMMCVCVHRGTILNYQGGCVGVSLWNGINKRVCEYVCRSRHAHPPTYPHTPTQTDVYDSATKDNAHPN